MSDNERSQAKQWHPTTPAIEPDALEYVIGGPPAMVHFWAPWNQYDKAFDANLQQLRPAYEKKFRFFSVNTDLTAFSSIVEQHHVAALPSLLCFVNGRIRGRFHGIQTVDALKTFLEEMTQGPQR